MADAATLPADLFRPEVASEYFGYEFGDSLELADRAIGVGSQYPIQIVDLDNLRQGVAATIQQPKFKEISSLIARRDITSIAAVDTKKLEGRNDIGVVVHCKIGPVSIGMDSSWLTKASLGQIEAEIARQAAHQAKLQLQTSVIYALYGIIAAVTASAHTKSVWSATDRANLDTELLALTLQKMGDMSDRITHWLMRSESYFDLLNNQMGRNFQGIADRAMQGADPAMLSRGRSVVDSAALTTADAGFDKYYTMGIGPSLLKVQMLKPATFYQPQMYVDTEVVQVILRADFDFALLPTGVAYTGSAAPSDATLGTSGNWTVTYSNHKEVHGVMAEHNVSSN